MIASELVKALQKVIKEKGDFPVSYMDYEFGSHNEILRIEMERELRCDEHYNSRHTGRTVIALHSI